ncbi:MAG TPA: DNA polymerase domain-containing protein [Chthonomonadales bacterium]|nr:DNA polymerase domain-containing protein [Chthonomonadales bacterium]
MGGQLSLFDDGPSNAGHLRSPPSAVLFGADATERIVSVEVSEALVTTYLRCEDGRLHVERGQLAPWLLTAAPRAVLGRPAITLAGAGELRHLFEFADLAEYHEARRALRDAQIVHYSAANPVRMHLLRSGRTLFKGMSMRDVVRMQLDIETEGLRAHTGDRVLMVALRDSLGWEECVVGAETEIVERVVEAVRDRDPDVIEGHNIHGFDLPFLVERARQMGIPLALGRDGSEPRIGAERQFAVGGITRPIQPVFIHGRHVIDTYLAVQRFDWARGELSGYGLKEVARAYGIAAEDRIELPREEMSRLFRDDPERVCRYAQQDVLETKRLADLVTATEFYQTQMVPDNYGAVAVGGSGEKINTLLVRAYLHAGHGLPMPQAPRSYPGGYTELCETGVLERVVKADVESLYPSIMLTDGIRPSTDTLGVFLPALEELTRRRLDAKGRARRADGADRQFWDGLQGSFKVLINSFYGYLGAPGMHFNDPDAAGCVTARGRQIVQQVAEEMRRTGSTVIEIDTDGVYFVPPADVEGEAAEELYVERVGATLPRGIRLAFDGRYRAMISLKTKNYVLQGYDGRRVIKGASLRSRADEPYGRAFLSEAIDLLLADRRAEIGPLYRRYVADLRDGRCGIGDLARRERVTAKTFGSAARQRLAEVAANVPVGDYVIVYERADGRLGLVDDWERNGRDTNAEYYLDKLHKFASRLSEAFPGDFDTIVPRPSALRAEVAGQLDLFAP